MRNSTFFLRENMAGYEICDVCRIATVVLTSHRTENFAPKKILSCHRTQSGGMYQKGAAAGAGAEGLTALWVPPNPNRQKNESKNIGEGSCSSSFFVREKRRGMKVKNNKRTGELRAVVKVRGRPPLILLSFENVCQRYYRRRRSRKGN